MLDGAIKVTFIDKMGIDMTVVNAARVSFGVHSEEWSEKDEKLVDYLAKHQHLSPFEHCALTIMVECPLYIRSQIHRHRTFAYNEISRRYTDDGIEFYFPPEEDVRTQAKNNKQGSDAPVSQETAKMALDIMQATVINAKNAYDVLIELGVAREQARGILPQCLMTKFYMSGNLRNFAHFVELRIDAHAQKEAQYVARRVQDIMTAHFFHAAKALFKHGGKPG